MKPNVAVVEFPIKRLIIYDDRQIIAAFTGKEFDAQFKARLGKYALNRTAARSGWRRFAALSFTDGLQQPPLMPDPDDTHALRMSGPSLWSWLLSLAAGRPADAEGWSEIDVRDLDSLFERHTNSRNHAESWLNEVMPFLLDGTSLDRLPDGSFRRYSIEQERAMRGALWAGRRWVQ